MRTNIPGIFALVLSLLLILGTGCVTQSATGQETRQDVQISPIPVPADTERISFEVAKTELTSYTLNRFNESGNPTNVHYMRSRNVDEYGRAEGWIFGVINGDEADFLVYDRLGWKTIANATLPAEVILLDNVVSPEKLFTLNKDVLTGEISGTIFEQRDLELQRGIYTLTITSGSTGRTLTFNATTGALIPYQ